MAEILIAFGSGYDLRIWPNNTGALQVGERFVRFGLKGSADILGIARGGIMLAIEVKTGSGKQTTQQLAFQRMVEHYGGIYVLARSITDVAVKLAAYTLR